MNLRYDIAREAVSRGERVLVVPVAPPKPELQPNPGLSTDPQEYQNRHFSLFFGLDSVRVEGTANPGSENRRQPHGGGRSCALLPAWRPVEAGL